jgi:hypothetical protein
VRSPRSLVLAVLAIVAAFVGISLFVL